MRQKSSFIIGSLVVFLAIGISCAGVAWFSVTNKLNRTEKTVEDSVRATLGPLGALSYASLTVRPFDGTVVLQDVTVFRPGFALTAEMVTLSGRNGGNAKGVRVVTDQGFLDAASVTLTGADITAGGLAISSLRADRVTSEIALGALKFRPSFQWVTVSEAGTAAMRISGSGFALPIKSAGIDATLRATEVAGQRSPQGVLTVKTEAATIIDSSGIVLADIAFSELFFPISNAQTVKFVGTGTSVGFHIPSLRAKEAMALVGYGADIRGNIKLQGSLDAKSGALEFSPAFVMDHLGTLSGHMEFRRSKPGEATVNWPAVEASMHWQDAPEFQQALTTRANKAQISLQALRTRMWDYCSPSSTDALVLSVKAAIVASARGISTFDVPLKPVGSLASDLEEMLEQSQAGAFSAPR